MKLPFVQSAEVDLDSGADPAGPGGAVTVALCGSWDHPGACRWPHLTNARWQGGRGSLRVVFVSDAAEEANVRTLIDGALAGGGCTGPDGTVSRWTLLASKAAIVTDKERILATQIAPAPGEK